MSNSISRNLLQQSLLCSTVFEHPSKLRSSGIPANSLFQAASVNQPAGAAAARKSPLSTKFYGTSLNVRRPKLAMGTHRPVLITPRAVLAVDPASEVIFPLPDIENQSMYFSVSDLLTDLVANE